MPRPGRAQRERDHGRRSHDRQQQPAEDERVAGVQKHELHADQRPASSTGAGGDDVPAAHASGDLRRATEQEPQAGAP